MRRPRAARRPARLSLPGVRLDSASSQLLALRSQRGEAIACDRFRFWRVMATVGREAGARSHQFPESQALLRDPAFRLSTEVFPCSIRAKHVPDRQAALGVEYCPAYSGRPGFRALALCLDIQSAGKGIGAGVDLQGAFPHSKSALQTVFLSPESYPA